MNLCHLVYRPDSLTYTVVKALSYGGHQTIVCVADPEYQSRPAEKFRRMLDATSGVRVVTGSDDALPPAVDRLIVQVYPRLMERADDFDRLAQRSRRVTLITAGDRSRTWRTAARLQWQEIRRFGLRPGRIDRIVYKDGFYRCDLYGLFKPRSVVGFDVHSQFLHDETSFHAIHACDWNPELPRPVLVNFLGSRDPEPRLRVLDAVRPFFQGPNGVPPVRLTRKPSFWHEYSDALPAGIGSTEFLDVLTRSDFTLCPPGYSLVTHRPMEALLRGSIPVLNANEVDLYDIGLEDGVNCIAVGGGKWQEAMKRLAGIGEEQIIGMRRNIRDIVPERIAYDAAAERMQRRLGIDGVLGAKARPSAVILQA